MFDAGVAVREFYGKEEVESFYREFDGCMKHLLAYTKERDCSGICFIGGIVSGQNGVFLAPLNGKSMGGVTLKFCCLNQLQEIDEEFLYVGCLDSYHVEKELACKVFFDTQEFMGFDAVMQWASHFVMTLTVQQLFALSLCEFWLKEQK
ncbi:MAG: hypothetical protein IJT01_13445 [Selenomonadaceae bacterium]|nr:hypothetical protein [Selenomonadaceae bacterium]